MRLHVISAVLGAAAALFASVAAAEFVPVRTGFDTGEIAEGVTLSRYQAVHVAPTLVALEPSRNDFPLSEEDAARNAEALTRALARRFGDDAPLAEGPDGDVLTIRATLTAVRATRPTLRALEEERGLDLARSIGAGGASATFELLVDGEVVARFSDNYQTTLTDRRPRVGMWDDADRAYQAWARTLEKTIERN